MLAGSLSVEAARDDPPVRVYVVEVYKYERLDAMSDELTELTYEEAYQQLEQILTQLESGDLPLEESLALYEKGATLAAVCSKILDDAELRVQQWQPNGSVTPMDDWQASDSA